MQIESIEIKNYRALKNAKLENLPSLVALIGANGTGKSTVFDVFSFLKDSLTGNVGKAVMKRGGFKELVSRGTDGPIQIILKFRESGGRLATYELSVVRWMAKLSLKRKY
jgi:predicted ATPase